MKKLLLAGAALLLLAGGLAFAQNINRSLQLNQSPQGPVVMDDQNNVYFPASIYAKNGTANVQVFSTAGAATWTPPSSVSYSWVQVLACGAGGGGGGGGAGVASGTAFSGGSGGGGGACIQQLFKAADFGTSVTLTVGAAAAAATAAQSGQR